MPKKFRNMHLYTLKFLFGLNIKQKNSSFENSLIKEYFFRKTIYTSDSGISLRSKTGWANDDKTECAKPTHAPFPLSGLCMRNCRQKEEEKDES